MSNPTQMSARRKNFSPDTFAEEEIDTSETDNVIKVIACVGLAILGTIAVGSIAAYMGVLL